MTRAMAIEHLRVAGYHDDRGAFTRLYVENRISYEAAKKAYGEGRSLRAQGIGCTCTVCKKAKADEQRTS